MAKKSYLWLWVGLAALILGLLVGALAFPVTNTVTVTKTVTEEVEVPVEVEVETLVNVPEDLRLQAFDDFWAHLDDEELFICNGDEYDEDEASFVKFYDEYSIEYDEDDYTVNFSSKLKYKESDYRSCRETYDVSVFYEEDEDPVVTIL